MLCQVLQDHNTTTACDIWALGCILFCLLTGRTPFHSASEYLTFQSILHHCDGSEPLQYPETVPPLAQDLIGAILRSEPSERLGAGDDQENGYAALKGHPFFTVSGLDHCYFSNTACLLMKQCVGNSVGKTSE